MTLNLPNKLDIKDDKQISIEYHRDITYFIHWYLQFKAITTGGILKNTRSITTFGASYSPFFKVKEILDSKNWIPNQKPLGSFLISDQRVGTDWTIVSLVSRQF